MARKPAAKKPASKKAPTKKATTKKTSSKKKTSKKTASSIAPSKKSPSKKTTTKKTTSRKTTPKKITSKKTAPKKITSRKSPVASATATPANASHPGPRPGDAAPRLALRDQNDQLHSLGDYTGRHVVLYFYPKDDTSGCTAEACQFRDDLPAFEHLNAKVLGVSILNTASKAKFARKHSLNFPLLADDRTDADGNPDPEVAQLFGVWTQKSMYGRTYMGIERTTFLIGPQGTVLERWDKVSVPGHADDVKAAIQRHTR